MPSKRSLDEWAISETKTVEVEVEVGWEEVALSGWMCVCVCVCSIASPLLVRVTAPGFILDRGP